ncbi:MAG: IS4 family transposase [Candidatus Diapherotrites archaeon]|nr:IS4 family transposase [Candidatus Diapherotrites archaeon]
MSANRLYHTWFERIRQLLPDVRITRLRNFVWLIVGIYQSKSVHLSDIAGKIPGQAKELSIVRRLSRFLANPAVRVRAWYAAIAKNLLQSMAQTVGEIRLIADGTKVGFHHQLLIIALAYRRRALPIAWTWVRCAKGHSSARKQLALLAYVRGLIPAGVPVLLVGDSEFGAVPVIRQLEKWHWSYVLRQKANHQVKLAGSHHWQRLGDLIHHPGQSIWLGPALLTAKYAHPVNLLLHWKVGEDEPWLLATNLPSRRETLRAYRRRMWIEEMFGDLKGHGFDLESTHLCHFLRLSRLTLAVALLYVWLVSTGARAIKNGQRQWVDRKDRRDLSIFRIGLRLLDRYLVNGLSISIPLCPNYGCKLSGG